MSIQLFLRSLNNLKRGSHGVGAKILELAKASAHPILSSGKGSREANLCSRSRRSSRKEAQSELKPFVGVTQGLRLAAVFIT